MFMGYCVTHGIVIVAVVVQCLCKLSENESDVRLGHACNPAEDRTWYPLKEEFTKFILCSPTSKKYVKNECPTLRGLPQYFDDETRKCFTPRSRTKRTPGIPKSAGIGDACFYNTDCFDNMFCLSGRCNCNPSWVGAPGSNQRCIKTVNPGQPGCEFNVQCSGAWPGTTCTAGICVCPSLTDAAGTAYTTVAVQTMDGYVCVRLQDGGATVVNARALALCPTPEGFIGTAAVQLNEVQTVEAPAGATTIGALRQQCNTDRSAAATCLAPDIYDCIPFQPGLVAGVCCPSRTLVCVQPKKPSATGVGSSNRYWYNSVTGLCEIFVWNPLPGGAATSAADSNGNNFVTMEHCLSYCRGTCQRGAPKLNADVAGTMTQVQTCTATSQCTADAGNTLISYDCITTFDPTQCCPKRSATCSRTGGRGSASYTTMPATEVLDPGTELSGDGGVAGATSPYLQRNRWYYNTATATCTSFRYGGRQGNFNNFLSQADCVAFCGSSVCQGTPLLNSVGQNQQCGSNLPCPSTHVCTSNICCPRPQAVCIQPKQTGTCSNLGQRYWYNANTRDCEVFDYTGCGGNDNNFPDYVTCMNYCRDQKPQPRCIQGEAQKSNNVYATCTPGGSGCLTGYSCEFDGTSYGCCPTKTYTCGLGQNLGIACEYPAGPRFWYNPSTRLCVSFTYRGCDGNSNNFISQAECDRYCGSSGCPYGGLPQNVAGTTTRLICSSTTPCGAGYDCLNVLISNTPFNVCCLSRNAICTQSTAQGNTLGVQSTRFYFDQSSRTCKSFTYYGSGGNENNFNTATQCTNFCNSAACNLGETVQLDANSQPQTCNPQITTTSTCQTGYTCRQDTLFNRNVCCGSSDMGVCPTGERAFVEPLTLQPRECTISTVNQCSNNFLCRNNPALNRNYCCASITGLFCPAGKAVLRDVITRQPRSCFQAAVDQCQTTGYTCQPLVTGQTGYCCSVNAICPNNADFLLDDLQRPRTCIVTTTGANPCGTGYQCLATTTTSTNGYCCRTSVPTTDGCPSGQTVLTVSGVIQTCGGIGVAPACPPTYTCTLNSIVTPNRFQCCGTTTPTNDPDGCGIGQIAYKDPTTQVIRQCTVGAQGACPIGFGCATTSVGGQLRCCGTSLGCPANSVAQINPSTGAAQTCSGLGQACSGIGYQCQQATTGLICCSTGLIDGTTTTTTTIAPPRTARCPFSNQTPYLTPGTTSTVTCDPRSNSCPNSYPCLNGGMGFICCVPSTTGSQCATGVVNIVNGQPQTCIANACPAGFRCTYSTTFRTYYCCSGGGVVVTTRAPSNACLSGTPYFTAGSPTPARCSPGVQQPAIGSCPPGYSCAQSPQYQTTICCSGNVAFINGGGSVVVPRPSSSACTSGMPHITPGSSVPSRCSPGARQGTVGSCPSGYSCVNSPTHQTTICCSGNVAFSNPQNTNDCSPVMFDSASPLNCGPNPSACPAGSVCRRNTSHSHMVCCRN